MKGNNIRLARMQLYLTQAEFAKIIGVHTIVVSQWERDVRNPSLRHQKQIIDLCKQNGIEINF